MHRGKKYSKWIFAGILLVLVLEHRWIFRQLATPLIIHQAAGEAHVLAVHNEYGDQRYEIASQAFQNSKRRAVLLFEGEKQRRQLLGVLPSFEQMSVRELTKRGVAAVNIEVIAGNHQTDFDIARSLDHWLGEHPNDTIAIYWRQFNTRRFAKICDDTMAENRRARLRIVGLRDRRFDDASWWTCRVGIKEFLGAWHALAYAYLRGQDAPRPMNFDPDAYEAAVVQGEGSGRVESSICGEEY